MHSFVFISEFSTKKFLNRYHVFSLKANRFLKVSEHDRDITAKPLISLGPQKGHLKVSAI